MSNLVRVLVTCIRHPDVHTFIYNCIFVRLLYIFVYINPYKKIRVLERSNRRRQMFFGVLSIMPCATAVNDVLVSCVQPLVSHVRPYV